LNLAADVRQPSDDVSDLHRDTDRRCRARRDPGQGQAIEKSSASSPATAAGLLVGTHADV